MRHSSHAGSNLAPTATQILTLMRIQFLPCHGHTARNGFYLQRLRTQRRRYSQTRSGDITTAKQATIDKIKKKGNAGLRGVGAKRAVVRVVKILGVINKHGRSRGHGVCGRRKRRKGRLLIYFEDLLVCEEFETSLSAGLRVLL